MLITHTSNLSENLLQHLAKVIGASPLSSPFESELFLIQSQGMERWISQQLASEFGVWGNAEFLFPSKFFSRLADSVDQPLRTELFSRQALVWHFDAILSEVESEPDFEVLQQYLRASDPSALALKRFYFARELAMLFDQYQMMRHEMLTAWQKHALCLPDEPSEAWQALLWRKLLSRVGSQAHRGEIWQQAIAALEENQPLFVKALPERIHIFGLNTLPPLFLKFVQAVALHTDVHLYLLSPTASFWGDVLSKKQQLKATQQTEQMDLFSLTAEAEHETNAYFPLLGALAQQGKDFNLAIQTGEFEAGFGFDSFVEHDAPETALHWIQNGLYRNDVAGFSHASLTQDASISVHSCHSAYREVQVLRDQLWQILDQDPTIQLRDIVVMAPDIQTYAPFIESVFESVRYSIADRSLKLESSAVERFTNLLSLLKSRFEWEAVLDFIAAPEIMSKQGWDEEDLSLIQKWVVESQIRWGRSQDQRTEAGLPAFSENSWRFGLDRMLMGFMLGSFENDANDTVPYLEIEGSRINLLSELYQQIQTLMSMSEQANQARTRTDWQVTFMDWSRQLFDDKQTDLMPLTEVLTSLTEVTVDAAVDPDTQTYSLEVMSAWLKGQVSESKSSSGFLRGQLTFCSMLPMRAIPFKVIALLGMNEGAFPKVTPNLSFDLMPRNWQSGDRSRRADERYQFLEVLLSVRKHLIISYQGQSIQTNDELPPSIVVSELLVELEKLSLPQTQWVTVHPLHGHHSSYFENKPNAVTPALVSYNAQAFELAQTLTQPKSVKTALAWWQGQIETSKWVDLLTKADQFQISLMDLIRFAKNPHAVFLRHVLDLYATKSEEAIAPLETFTLNALMESNLISDWVVALKACEDLEGDAQMGAIQQVHQTQRALLKGSGSWPLGIQGEQLLDHYQNEVETFFLGLQEKSLGKKQQPLEQDFARLFYSDDASLKTLNRLPFELTLADNVTLVANFTLYDKALVYSRYGKMQLKDSIQAWLGHLFYCATCGVTERKPRPTIVWMRDAELCFQPLEAIVARQMLLKWIQLYLQGHREPSQWLVKPAGAWLEALSKAKPGVDEQVTLQKAMLAAETSFDESKKNEPNWQLLWPELSGKEVLREVFDEVDSMWKDLLTPYQDHQIEYEAFEQ